MNRRVMYNRTSCDLSGKPWNTDRAQIWWNDAQQKWLGNDVSDFKVDSPPKGHMMIDGKKTSVSAANTV